MERTRMWGLAAALMALAGCEVPGAIQPGEKVMTRQLGPDEKAALSTIVADGMKDPDAARFKWMPVVLRQREGITDYCALVNGKTSYGGYTGFTPFYGQLVKDADGRFTRIFVRSMDAPSDGIDVVGRLCNAYGYVDFGGAQ